MRPSSLFGPAAAGFSVLLSVFQPTVNGLSFNPVSPPDLDLSSLGRVVFTGNFDAVSLYSYEEQSENNVVNNNAQSLSTPLPNGLFATLSKSDGQLHAMCPFTKKDGSFSGIIVGGNFTSLGDVEAHGIAKFNPNTTKVTPLPGLSGSALALLCDKDTNSVYVGGDLKLKGNNTNAAVWHDGEGWKSLPFHGFNGPVTSIIKDDNGHIIFGGSFDNLGDKKASRKGQQVVNLQTANVHSDAKSSKDGYRDPHNIICQTSGEDAEGKTWLLADNSPGFWRADMDFPFTPTKLRLYNTHLDGRGTKNFLFRALPDNGIMNLTYTDPDSGDDVNCDASCPLSDSKKEKYRDFHFVNDVGMHGFMLEIQDWYGDGAGLNGIELFQNKTFAYAINDFNEPTCANLDTPSRSEQTGSWTRSQSGFLTSKVTDGNAKDSSIVFEPDLRRSGNYSVKVYTPGCIGDGTCDSRGIVNVKATLTSDSDEGGPIETPIHQTNYYDKYDTIYSGYVDGSGSSFRPRVSLTPKPGQGDFTVVAWRVGFDLISSDGSGSGELNGLYDYDPSSKRAEKDSTASAIAKALHGTRHLSVKSLTNHDQVVYAGGKFSNQDIHNVMYIEDGNATAMPEGGLNGEVIAMSKSGDFLYIGGNFTNTPDGGNGDLKHIAAYSFGSKDWSALGRGLNGPVKTVFSLPLNVSRDINETVVAVSGDFDEIEAFDNYPAIPVSGFAVWVPSRKNWLQNLNVTQMQFAGQLSGFATVGNTTILGGSLVSDGIATGDAVSLLYNDGFSLEPLLRKVDRSSGSTGTFTGVYDTNSGRNLTIIGGHFSATTSKGTTIENLVIYDGKDNSLSGLDKGVDSNSTFLAFSVAGDTLYAGGNVTGKVDKSTVKGCVAYDLNSGDYVENQPPPLNGDNVSVNSISKRPGSSEVYFGGNFEDAGALPCPSVCYYDTSDGNWNRPGVSIAGTVLALEWASEKELYAVGDLKVEGNETVVATYNAKKQTWKSFEGASKSEIPGTVTAFSPASTDLSQFWLAGDSTNGSSFLLNYDGSKFQSAGNIFGDGTSIRGLEALTLSNDHEHSDYLDKDLILLVTGQLVIPDFGKASAALFDGTTLTPFILSSSYNGDPGSMSRIITEHKNPYSRDSNNHSNGIVVLISFCLALGCVFLIVVAGVILNKIQRHRQGYVQAPQGIGMDRPTTMQRVPPEYLFNSLRQPNPGAPTI